MSFLRRLTRKELNKNKEIISLKNRGGIKTATGAQPCLQWPNRDKVTGERGSYTIVKLINYIGHPIIVKKWSKPDCVINIWLKNKKYMY